MMVAMQNGPSGPLTGDFTGDFYIESLTLTYNAGTLTTRLKGRDCSQLWLHAS